MEQQKERDRLTDLMEERKSKYLVPKHKVVTFEQLRNLLSDNQIQFAKFQRSIDTSRAKAICEYIKHYYSERTFSLGAPLICFTTGDPSPLFMLDGQHRVHAVKSVPLGVAEILADYPIHALVYEDISVEMAFELFKTLNLAIPVPSIYLTSIARDGAANNFALYYEWLRSEFAHCIRPSAEPHLENINVDRIIAYLQLGTDKELLAMGCGSFEHLRDTTLLINEYIQKRLEKEGIFAFKSLNGLGKGTESSLSSAMEKVRFKAHQSGKRECYLGFVKSCKWVDLLITFSKEISR